MNQKETGKRNEEKAAAYLTEKGVRLVEKNFRCRQGEVDLIGYHENCLVFVEVKYRKTALAGAPEEAVDYRKQLKICAVSDYYRISHPAARARQVRYDVVAICGDEITWYQNAFPYCRRSGSGFW